MPLSTLKRVPKQGWWRGRSYCLECRAVLVAGVAAATGSLWGWLLGAENGVVPWWTYAIVCGVSVFLLVHALFQRWHTADEDHLRPLPPPASRPEAELQQLRKATAYRHDFLADVSHELKTTVFLLQGFIDALNEDKKNFSKPQRRLLKRAREQVEALAQLIEDLLTSALMESGAIRMHPTEVSLRALCEEMLEAFSKNARIAAVQLQLKAPPELHAVWADKRYLRQVLRNLLDNAIRYNQPKGLVTLRIAPKDAQRLTLSVIDTGIGIAPDEQHRIFERFYRVEKSRDKAHGGSGIGLALVRHILEAHGETITVASQPLRGSVFSFTLPYATTANAPSAEAQS